MAASAVAAAADNDFLLCRRRFKGFRKFFARHRNFHFFHCIQNDVICCGDVIIKFVPYLDIAFHNRGDVLLSVEWLLSAETTQTSQTEEVEREELSLIWEGIEKPTRKSTPLFSSLPRSLLLFAFTSLIKAARSLNETVSGIEIWHSGDKTSVYTAERKWRHAVI